MYIFKEQTKVFNSLCHKGYGYLNYNSQYTQTPYPEKLAGQGY